MNYEKQYLILEAERFYKEYNRSPKATEWDEKNSYPTFWFVKKEFGLWTDFLKKAGLPLNTQCKEKYIICKICGRKFKTTRINRKLCDSAKCRYINHSVHHVKHLKERYACSVFHFIPEDKLIEHFACLYKIKKKNLSMMRVV